MVLKQKAKTSIVPVQLEMTGVLEPGFRWGGKRAGAGRRRVPGRRSSVAHRARAVHDGRHPVHVTLRARPGLPSFRHERVSGMLRSVLLDQRKRQYAKVFQVVEFSIQDNHLHLIVEATGVIENGRIDAPDALRAGVSGLVIAFAKRLNMMLGRRGKVWGDRWFGRELATPREVRNALVYVFRNVAKHGTRLIGVGLVDPYSSASRFWGWNGVVRPLIEPGLWPHVPPGTWLLETGWHTHHGYLDPREAQRMGN